MSELLLQARPWTTVFYFASSLLLPSGLRLMKKIKGVINQMRTLYYLLTVELLFK